MVQWYRTQRCLVGCHFLLMFIFMLLFLFLLLWAVHCTLIFSSVGLVCKACWVVWLHNGHGQSEGTVSRLPKVSAYVTACRICLLYFLHPFHHHHHHLFHDHVEWLFWFIGCIHDWWASSLFPSDKPCLLVFVKDYFAWMVHKM